MPKTVNKDWSRRTFMERSAASLLVGTMLASVKADSVTPSFKRSGQMFDPTEEYSRAELLGLYHQGGEVGIKSAPKARDSVIFYWDASTKKLTNPFNLTPDTRYKTGTYGIKAEILNFHPAAKDKEDIWDKLETNLQLTFMTTAADPSGNLYTWFTLAAIEVAENLLGGSDKKLLPMPPNSSLTKFDQNEQIAISDGDVSLRIGIAGQRKEGFWGWLFSLFSAASKSPLVGLLPIPKLAASAAQAFGGLLDEVQKHNKLVQVLNGKLLKFRLNEDSTNSFALKPGFWVLIDAQAAAVDIDKTTKNLGTYTLDIPGQLYELKDKNDKPVDATYCVFDVRLPEIKKSA